MTREPPLNCVGLTFASSAPERVSKTSLATFRARWTQAAAIQRSGRAALADLRRIVGVLRADGEGASLLPAPGLGDADQLVARLADAGLSVALEVRGHPRPLPDGVELVAYRVLQEALTNALRHAGRTRATATVAYGGTDVTVEVYDEGPARGHVPPPATGGHGLAGARERLALYGGELMAGPSGTSQSCGFSPRRMASPRLATVTFDPALATSEHPGW